MRLQVRFNGEKCSFLFSLKEKRLLCYEQHRDLIHSKWGGEAYYTSCSGLSGAGWVDIHPSDLVIPLKGYRVRVGSEICPLNEGEVAVPFVAHEGVSCRHPFVLKEVDGDTRCVHLHFFWEEDLFQALTKGLDESGTPAHEGEDTTYSFEGERWWPNTTSWKLFNPKGLRGTNVVRFLRTTPSKGEYDRRSTLDGVFFGCIDPCQRLGSEVFLPSYLAGGNREGNPFPIARLDAGHVAVEVLEEAPQPGTQFGSWTWLTPTTMWRPTTSFKEVAVYDWVEDEYKLHPMETWLASIE